MVTNEVYKALQHSGNIFHIHSFCMLLHGTVQHSHADIRTWLLFIQNQELNSRAVWSCYGRPWPMKSTWKIKNISKANNWPGLHWYQHRLLHLLFCHLHTSVGANREASCKDPYVSTHVVLSSQITEYLHIIKIYAQTRFCNCRELTALLWVILMSSSIRYGN